MGVDIDEILNGRRDYQFYEPDPKIRETLETLEAHAKRGRLNGPSGNEYVLRLIEIIRALQEEYRDGSI